MWPPIERAYRWVHRIAHLLVHPERRRSRGMRRAMESLIRGMTRALPAVGPLRGALEHFLKVTRSYWEGLFHCYDVPDLPRTNNDLEQLFGAYRHHERRVRGQKVASAGMVVRGRVRIVAATATRLRRPEGADLAPDDLAAWRSLRRELEGRQELRVLARRYRQKPRAYLRRLESFLKLALPP
jgi:hypothetical protein